MKLDPTGCIDTYNGRGYFQVRDNWQGKGYRLYYGDDKTCSQVDGEINGKVYRTITAAKVKPSASIKDKLTHLLSH